MHPVTKAFFEKVIESLQAEKSKKTVSTPPRVHAFIAPPPGIAHSLLSEFTGTVISINKT